MRADRMRHFKMLVFTDPFEGQDDAYNDWYSNRHLSDVCAIPGFTGAVRYSLHRQVLGNGASGFLAIYDMKTDAPDVTIDQLFALAGTEAMPLSPAFDLNAATAVVYEELPGASHGKREAATTS